MIDKKRQILQFEVVFISQQIQIFSEKKARKSPFFRKQGRYEVVQSRGVGNGRWGTCDNDLNTRYENHVNHVFGSAGNWQVVEWEPQPLQNQTQTPQGLSIIPLHINNYHSKTVASNAAAAIPRLRLLQTYFTSPYFPWDDAGWHGNGLAAVSHESTCMQANEAISESYKIACCKKNLILAW